MQAGFLIGAILGDGEWQTRAVLGTMVGQPVRLPRLDVERGVFRSAGFLPAMWHEILIAGTSPPSSHEMVDRLSALSADARSLLALNGLLGRQTVRARGKLGPRLIGGSTAASSRRTSAWARSGWVRGPSFLPSSTAILNTGVTIVGNGQWAQLANWWRGS